MSNFSWCSINTKSEATTCFSSPLVSILDSEEATVHDDLPGLEIDPELVRILMQITEQDLTPVHPSMGPDAVDWEMRVSAEKDFNEWKQRRRLERKSSRLSRHDSGSTTDTAPRKLSYRHTVSNNGSLRSSKHLCYYNSDPCGA